MTRKARNKRQVIAWCTRQGRDFYQFLSENKKWWITPIVLFLLVLIAVLIAIALVSAKGQLPYMYQVSSFFDSVAIRVTG